MSEPITYRGTAYPWQCDHIGHLNVMYYVGKLDEATWNFFASIGMTPAYLRDGGHGMAAVQQNIAYRRELLPGDIIEVRTRVAEIRDKVIRFVHTMRNAESGEVAAECELTCVHIDRVTRRSCPFPEAVRKTAAARMASASA